MSSKRGMVVESKSSKWFKLITDQAYIKSVQSYLFNWVSDRKDIYHKKLNVLNIFNNLNNFLNTDINSQDILQTIKNIILNDLSCNFIAICTINRDNNTINIALTQKDYSSFDYTILNSSASKELIQLLNSIKAHRLTTIPDELLNYIFDTGIKQVIGIPIKSYNSTLYTICIGMDHYSRTTETIINLIIQYTSLIFANNELTSLIKEKDPLKESINFLSYKSFEQEISFELNKSRDFNKQLSLILIEISILHPCVLKIVSRLLFKSFSERAIYSKLNEFKFAVILPGKSFNHAHLMAKSFLSDLEHTFNKDYIDFKVNIGLSTYPNNSKTKEELIKNAEKALNIARNKSNSENHSIIINANDLKYSNDKYRTNPIIQSRKPPELSQDLANELINNVYNNRYIEPSPHDTYNALASLIDSKDQYIREHSYAVSKYAEIICEELGLSQQEIENISMGALLHDIGKIGIPQKVLSKPTQLNDKEWEIIKQHPTIGARNIIQPISALNDLIPVIEHHHERWDGRGYPHGLRKEEIPLGARVVSIVDAFHTMTTDRPYRKSLGYKNAVDILKNGSGTQWDSSLVESFLHISEKAYKSIQHEYTDKQ